MEDIPAPILEDCAQLVKANSIQGNKLNNIEIVYTPHTNLKKLPSMEVGQARIECADHDHETHTEMLLICDMGWEANALLCLVSNGHRCFTSVLQVSFHSAKLVKKVKVAAKVNDTVNRLNRTKKELYPDLSAEKESYDKEVMRLRGLID